MRPLTRSCFLLILLGKLFLLALPVLLGTCLRSLWIPPFPLHAHALILLSLAKVRLSPILFLSPPHDLVLWTDGSVSFPLGKGGSGVLANCSLCGTEATLSFSEGPVCSSFSAEACAILHAICWSRQHQQVCYFSSLLLLSDSRSVLATLSSPPSFLSSQSLRQIWQELSSLSSCSIRLLWAPRTLVSFLRYLRPPQSLVVSLLLSLVSTLFFSRTGGVLSHRSFLTHRFLHFPPRNLCSLVMLAVSFLVFAATDTAFF